MGSLSSSCSRTCNSGLAVVAVVLLAGLLGQAAPASADALTISPTPGTPDASPQTQISILGTKPSRIKSVTVTGASSGPHPGSLRPYSGKRGASFVLDQPLTEGEAVDATVGVSGEKAVRFSFTVAVLGTTQAPLNLTSRQPDKLQHFVTEPDLAPPVITVNHNSERARRSGEILITPLPSPVVHPESDNAISIKPVGPGGAMIIDELGRLVWFDQTTAPTVAANLRVQQYRGHQVLTWWRGSVTPSAFGLGEGVIANHAYEEIATVHAGNGYPMDIHEFTLTPEGDALFTIYSPVLVHLPDTPEGTLSPMLDAIVQQVDVRTGLVTWEWHSYGHIPLSESFATPANSSSYDAFHINSIQALDHDKVLISARDTAAIYKLDRSSGRIVWTLGGKASDFELGPGAGFHLQHDAQMLPDGRISMFDDEAGPPQYALSSRGLILNLRQNPRRATVVQTFHRQADTSAQSEGSLQALPGGETFVGWGAQPFFSQFSARGRLLFDASLPADDGSYRVYREHWRTRPATVPAAAAERIDDDSVDVYASWNGATGVASWQVLAGDSYSPMSPVTEADRDGFETRIGVTGTDSTFAVRALDADGKVLATSAPVPAE
jgi:hypothetical protein